MRNYIYIFRCYFVMTVVVVATIFAFAGCVYDNIADADDDFELRLEFTTRADEEIQEPDHDHDANHKGEDVYNENKINRVKLFFYDKDANVDARAVHCMDFDNLGGTNTVSLRMDVSLRKSLNLLHTGNEARVFAVVNLPKDVTIASNATINEIKNTIVKTDFRVEGGTMGEFVMISPDKPDYIKVTERKTVEGKVYVKRTAAKIRIAMSFELDSDGFVQDYDPSDPENKGYLWEPLYDGMRVYITNGVSKAHLGGAEFDRKDLADDDYYKIAPSGIIEDDEEAFTGDYDTRARKVSPTSGINVDEDDNAQWYWNDVPLYSYPHSWENTPYEDRQTYLVIQVPWKRADQQVYKTFYYQVPVNLRGGEADDIDGNTWNIDDNTLESNMYYLVKLNIGMLGSFNPEDPLELNAHYYIVPWQDEIIEAGLKDNRYLVVDENYWDMHNIKDIDIPFYTSHETIVARTVMHFYNFNPPKDETIDGQYTEYVGFQLDRTVSWQKQRNDSDEKAKEISKVFDETEERSGEKIYNVTISNTDYLVHYSHDMMRWTECNSSGNPVFPVDILGDAQGYAGPTAYLTKTDMLNWSKIVVEITIIHKDEFEKGRLDNTRFQQTIYITQYPPQYIETDYNPGTNTAARGNEFVYVNKNATTSGTYAWENIANFATSQNRNPNMYVITVSQLDDRNYIIGDPRTLTPNNLLSNISCGVPKGTDIDKDNEVSNNGKTWGTFSVGSEDQYWVQNDERNWNYYWRNNSYYIVPTAYQYPHSMHQAQEAPDMDGNTRTLTYYYPADESTDANRKDNFIAPKLRIASSYGGIGGMMPRTYARRRCATYQEAGRPAGRWRLPTKAEMQFICNLSAQGKIPKLFSPNPGWGIVAGGGRDPFYKNINNYQGNGVYEWNKRFYQRLHPSYWCAQGLAYLDGGYGPEISDEGWLGLNGGEQSPTFGEVLIIDESEKAFGSSSDFCGATAVRCVYDEWYWVKEDGSQDIMDEGEDKAGWRKFTWGDKPKRNAQGN